MRIITNILSKLAIHLTKLTHTHTSINNEEYSRHADALMLIVSNLCRLWRNEKGKRERERKRNKDLHRAALVDDNKNKTTNTKWIWAKKGGSKDEWVWWGRRVIIRWCLRMKYVKPFFTLLDRVNILSSGIRWKPIKPHERSHERLVWGWGGKVETKREF